MCSCSAICFFSVCLLSLLSLCLASFIAFLYLTWSFNSFRISRSFLLFCSHFTLVFWFVVFYSDFYILTHYHIKCALFWPTWIQTFPTFFPLFRYFFLCLWSDPGVLFLRQLLVSSPFPLYAEIATYFGNLFRFSDYLVLFNSNQNFRVLFSGCSLLLFCRICISESV